MNEPLERVWRGYALDLLPVTDKARMVYRELEIEIVKLQRELAIADRNDLSAGSALELAGLDPDDDYVPNLHNAAVG